LLEKQTGAPESTALRVALWRAIHVQFDPPPHILEDEIGLKLAAPAEGWRDRPDMNPEYTRRFRAAIVARARFIEDLVLEKAGQGVGQYVILGAGLDTFAQRRPGIGPRLTIFEVDPPGPQAWKRQRLMELGYGVPDWLRFVPVDFETGPSWWDQIKAAGFNAGLSAVVSYAGVSMYLTQEAIMTTLRQAAKFAPGSTLAMTYLLPMEQMDPEERVGFGMAEKGARAGGTPFISFFTPARIMAMAREAGFKEVRCVSGADLTRRYFAGRKDGLRAGSEELLLATI